MSIPWPNPAMAAPSPVPQGEDHRIEIYKHVSYTPQGGMCFVDEWPHNVRFVFNQSGQLLSVDRVHGW